jgi:hypothetical protein
MPVNHAELLKKLEKIVKRRVDAAVGVPVTVTDIVVYQTNSDQAIPAPVGEFYP